MITIKSLVVVCVILFFASCTTVKNNFACVPGEGSTVASYLTDEADTSIPVDANVPISQGASTTQ